MHQAREETAASIPVLRNGDTLSRVEFERRETAMPGDIKAELIDGVVYMGPPTSPEHGRPHARVVTWLEIYSASTPGVDPYIDVTLRLDEKNEVRPDVFLATSPATGGIVRRDPDGIFRGAVELAVEVAYSSVSYDLHRKKEAFLRSGVLEYLVLLVESGQVRWFGLRDGEFELLDPDAAGVLRSGVFPGLWLDAPALLRSDTPAILETLGRGLATPEHAAFVAKLGARKG